MTGLYTTIQIFKDKAVISDFNDAIGIPIKIAVGNSSIAKEKILRAQK